MICAACSGPVAEGARFCARCGHEAGTPAAPVVAASPEQGLGDIRFVLGFFVVLLGCVLAGAILAALHTAVDHAVLVASALIALAAVVGALVARDAVAPLWRWGLSSRWTAAIVVVSLPIFAGVAAYVAVLERAFHLHGRELSFLHWGLGSALLLDCAVPAFFEELAFRGVIYSLLARRLAPWEALAISAFGFAILHLSVLSLATHLPLGLYFGWLRQRSGSVLPGMCAHFLHNGWVTVAAATAG